MLLSLSDRLDILQQLGQRLAQKDDYRAAVIQRTAGHNGWFTIDNQEKAIAAIAQQMLTPERLQEWVSAYEIPDKTEPQRVGLVMAGNIPLVGFHDLLCVFVSGHQAVIKLSEKSPFLIPYIIREFTQIDPRCASYFSVVDKLADFDRVIATGSNNTARYFTSYFGKYPHIIRRNRNGVAVLTGEESAEDLLALGEDVFRYYGMGCRNVAKLYLPQDYNFIPLLEALHEYRTIVLNNKYKNNFDYHYALYILNRVPYQGNGCILLTENENMQSPIANLYYQYYESKEALLEELAQRREEIQLIAGQANWLPHYAVPFGQAQQPGLSDYADGVDTLAFLLQPTQNGADK